MTLREAVTNIQRHARARSARAQLSAEGDEAVLRIEDDGRGGAIAPGNGLSGMRERLEALGGRLRVDSMPGRGTCIHVARAADPAVDGRRGRGRRRTQAATGRGLMDVARAHGANVRAVSGREWCGR